MAEPTDNPSSPIDDFPDRAKPGTLVTATERYTNAYHYYRVVRNTKAFVTLEELEAEKIASYSDTPIHHVRETRLKEPVRVLKEIKAHYNKKREWTITDGQPPDPRSSWNVISGFEAYTPGTILTSSFSHD